MIGCCFFQTECFYVILKSLKEANLTFSGSKDLELFQQLRRRHNGDISGKNAKCRQSPIFLDFFVFGSAFPASSTHWNANAKKKGRRGRDCTARVISTQQLACGLRRTRWNRVPRDVKGAVAGKIGSFDEHPGQLTDGQVGGER